MVVDANAPDVLHQDGPDFAWLDKACKVRGDPYSIPGDEDLESENESDDEMLLNDAATKGKERVSRSDDEILLSDADTKGKERVSRRDIEEESISDSVQYSPHLQAPGPPLQFHSDWNLGLDTLAGPSSGISRQQKHGSRQVGGSRVVKVKVPVGGETRKLVGGPLAIDRQGRTKGLVALGSRQKLNSKN